MTNTPSTAALVIASLTIIPNPQPETQLMILTLIRCHGPQFTLEESNSVMTAALRSDNLKFSTRVADQLNHAAGINN